MYEQAGDFIIFLEIKFSFENLLNFKGHFMAGSQAGKIWQIFIDCIKQIKDIKIIPLIFMSVLP